MAPRFSSWWPTVTALVNDRHGGCAERQAGLPKDHVQKMHPELASPVAPLARAPTEPPREHRSRAPEFYGFVALSSTSVLFVVYILWALLPDEYIVWLGVKWYPSRYAIPRINIYIYIISLMKTTGNGRCSCPRAPSSWSCSHTLFIFRLQSPVPLHLVT